MIGPNVAFIRPELLRLLDQYELIRDCLAGEVAVKKAKTKYLPMPDSTNKTRQNKERYEAYLMRASFLNVARRTHGGLLGQIFMRPPVEVVPDVLKHVMKNATGAGVSFDQVARKVAALTLAYSRCGVFIDYPEVDGAASRADLESGRIRPTVNTYSPMEVINWRVVENGAEEQLALVVLAESYIFADDGFEIKSAGRFRVLKLDDAGNYVQEIWEEPNPKQIDGSAIPKRGDWRMTKSISPKGFDGQPLREIPFRFVGSENNDTNPDHPNFYDICSLNMAHYRNSADYEEACFIMGQPTVKLKGLTEEWIKKHFADGVNFGSRGGIPLGKDMDAELLQAEANTMIKEAMDSKYQHMVAMGAKLVEEKSGQRTVFEVKSETTDKNSTLVNVSLNSTVVLEWALTVCASLLGVEDDSIEYVLNTDFDIAKKTPEERTQIMSEWKDGGISWQEMRNGLRAAGSATEDDTKVKAEVDAEAEKQMKLEAPLNQPGAAAFGKREKAAK